MNDPIKIIFGLYGAGGFAREVMPLVASITGEMHRVYFVETTPATNEVNGYPVIYEDEFLAMTDRKRYFNIAISDSRIREKLANTCMAKDIVPMSIQSPHAIIYDRNEIGEGAILCAHTLITSNAKIGRFFHANIYSYVAHDCMIGDFVTFAPNVHCNGHVHIHDHAYIGTGAILRNGTATKPLIIGEGAVVGMGAIVTKNVAPYTTVVGNPARPLDKKS